MPKILYSTGFGAGWSTWNSQEFQKIMLTWAPLIEAVERGDDISDTHPAVISMVEHIEREFGEDSYVCLLGASDLVVGEVDGPFIVQEYDGSESVLTASHLMTL